MILQGGVTWRRKRRELDGVTKTLNSGEALFSPSFFSSQTGMTPDDIQDFMDHLEERGLIVYPEGKPDDGSPYRVLLTEPWCMALKRRSLKQALIDPIPEGGREPVPRTRARSQAERQRSSAHTNGNGKPAGKPRKPETKPEPPAEKPAPKEAPAQPTEPAELDGLAEEWQRIVRVGFMGHPPNGARRKDQQIQLERMIKYEGRQQVRDGIAGMRKLYPWSEGERPFNVSDLDRHLDRAVAVERRSRDRRDSVKQHRQDNRMRKEVLRKKEDAQDQWAREIDAKWRQESEEVKAEIERKAWVGVPDAPSLSDSARNMIHRAAIRELYGQHIGKPAPR